MARRNTKHGWTDTQVFTYPVPPNKTQLFTKYRYVERPHTAAVTYLEQMLTKTSLTTQKVTHQDIENFGNHVYSNKVKRFEQEKHEAVERAVEETKREAKLQAKKALAAALDKANVEKETALEKQKTYYEEMKKRIIFGRDCLEKERTKQLVAKMEKEKDFALKEQWEKAERIKKETVVEALKEQKRVLRAESALERETSIARALSVARGKFDRKIEEEVDKVRQECWLVGKEQLNRSKIIHKHEIERLHERIAVLTQESKKVEKKRNLAQRDFINIENDYSHFLDFTTPVSCHSDYLITPRKVKHGMVESRREQQTQTNLIALDQKTQSVQTNVQILARR
ncbi:uncharacterized protein LOC100187073 [Ciona intestinalis]